MHGGPIDTCDGGGGGGGSLDTYVAYNCVIGIRRCEPNGVRQGRHDTCCLMVRCLGQDDRNRLALGPAVSCSDLPSILSKLMTSEADWKLYIWDLQQNPANKSY